MNRWQKGKPILLASLSCWILFTLPLGFIQPPATSCILHKNNTNYLFIPDTNQKIVKRSIKFGTEIFEPLDNNIKQNNTYLEKSRYGQFLIRNNNSHSQKVFEIYNYNFQKTVQQKNQNLNIHTNKNQVSK